MDIKIYQVYFDTAQLPVLDPAFIPYDNTKNEKPLLREYPILCDLYEQHKDYDGYWGITSWRWKEKRGPAGSHYINWINTNPGYDLYHFNHHPEMVPVHKNTIEQGDRYHRGLMTYMSKLLERMGFADKIDLSAKFPNELFITAHFYVGNQKFWANWMKFLNDALEISYKEKELNDYLFNTESKHRKQSLINFSFAVERLVVVFLRLHPEYKVLPYDNKVHVPRALR